jgi:hypothetical protein
MLVVLKAHSQSLHANLIGSYLRSIFDLFVKYFLIWGCLFWIIKRYRREYADYFYPSALLLMGLIGLDAGKVYKLAIALTLVRFIQLYPLRHLNAQQLLIFFGVFSPLILPVGTNNELIRSSTPYFGLSVPFLIVLFQDLRCWRPVAIKLFAPVAIGTMILLAILNPYRNPPLLSTQLEISGEKYFRGLILSREVADVIRSVRALKVPEKPVMAYNEAPFIPLLLGLRAFGTPWYFDHYDNLDIFACAFIGTERPGQEIIFALSHPLPAKIKQCLADQGIATLPEVKTSLEVWSPVGMQTYEFRW